jgi:hypothetical protein
MALSFQGRQAFFKGVDAIQEYALALGHRILTYGACALS